MKTFKTTIVNVKTKNKAECDSSAATMKVSSRNRLLDLSVEQFVQQLKSGYSFHPGVYDLNYNVYLCDGAWQGQQVFAADVDHGNLSLEGLQELLEQCPLDLEPSVIYESHSSSTEKRKYRVIFISNDLITNVEDALKIQKYLVVLFGQYFTTLEKVDFSCVNSSRLFFGTTADKIISSKETRFDAKELIDYIDESGMMDVYDRMWEENRPFHAKKGNSNNSCKKKSNSAKSKQPHESKMSLDEIIEKIEANLKQLADERNFDGEIIDYNQSYEFINSLPLTKILGWRLNDFYCCVLHDDNTPSAHIIEHVNGNELYHCFGCMEIETSYGTFDVLHRVFENRYNDTIMDSKERILELLGIELGSKYQRKAVKELEFARKHMNKLVDKGENPVASRLVSKKLLGFYFQMLTIAKDRVTYFPQTKTENERCATFFISYKSIMKECQKVGLIGCSTKHNIEKKINHLVAMGLIEKVSEIDIQDAFMKRTKNECKKRAKYLLASLSKEEIEQHIIELCLKNEAELLEVVTSKIKHVTYYRIPFLSAELLDEAFETIKHDNKYRVKANGNGVKQTTTLRGKDKAKTIYQQTDMVLSKMDEYFINEACKAIDMLIQKQGYFTEEQLLFKIDARSRYFKGPNKHRVKKNLSDKFLPGIIKHKKMTSENINKATRAKYNVPAKVTNKYMYVVEE